MLSPDAKGRPRLTARADLTADETRRLIAAVAGARLFDGDHVGTDTRAVDGVFGTLTVVKGARAVVLVTSGNPKFTEDGPRKELLSVLNGVEERLREQARR